MLDFLNRLPEAKEVKFFFCVVSAIAITVTLTVFFPRLVFVIFRIALPPLIVFLVTILVMVVVGIPHFAGYIRMKRENEIKYRQ